MKLKTLTISQVNDYISNYMATNPIFSNMSICGEVFNIKKTGYGYTFLSLKDNESKLNAISYLEDFDVKDGDFINVNGKLSFYKKNGTYSLIINKFEKIGKGTNYEQFKLLYEKLEVQGYFNTENKKSLPRFPQNIGIVTSFNGAAIKDIISVIKRRYPKVNLLIYDSKMQGIDAESSILKALNTLYEKNVDIIIISRGGGDSDDLSVFNSEFIAESVFNSNIPIISAIGHEIDYVICDFVADMRAPTPSIAGELSVPNLQDLNEMINNFENSIKISYKNIINRINSKINLYRFFIQSNAPYKKINEKKVLINNISLDLTENYKNKIEYYKNKLSDINITLQENNYVNILSKGFALLEKDEKLIKSVFKLSKGDNILLKLNDGTVKIVVEEIYPK